MTAPELSIRVPALVGLAALVALLAGVGTWSVATEIAGAVVSPGVVRIENERQVVQHPDGGVVGEILVRDGDVVAAGDALLRLDGTFLRTELAMVERQLARIFARRGRLDAERNRAVAVTYPDPPDLVSVDGPEFDRQLAEERALFAARAASLAEETRALTERARQIGLAAEGATAQIDALHQQLVLVRGEAHDLTTLRRNGLVPASRLNALYREEARLMGEIARLTSTIAEARASVSQIEVEIVRLAAARQEQAVAQLRDLEFAEIELMERRNGLLELVERLDIRAPVAGTVFGSTVFARRAVIRPAAPILHILPADQPFEVAVRIDPLDIDQVFVGQLATLVFPAFGRQSTPDIAGRIVRVSAVASADEATGLPYYEAIVAPDAAELRALGEDVLISGMPVETYLETGARTPLTYFTDPLAGYFRRAFREG